MLVRRADTVADADAPDAVADADASCMLLRTPPPPRPRRRHERAAEPSVTDAARDTASPESGRAHRAARHRQISEGGGSQGRNRHARYFNALGSAQFSATLLIPRLI